MDTDWKYSGIKDIVPTDESWLKEVLIKSVHDTAYFATTFLSESFDQAMTEQRLEHFRMLDDDSIPFGYIVAARGFAKTTSLCAKMVSNLCFRKTKFMMHSSRTLENATALTENVKLILLGNPKIREVFGCMRAASYKGHNPMFSKTAYYIADPKTSQPYAFVTPKGSEQQVNGALVYLVNRLVRPDFLSTDDLEDRFEVMNEINRINLANWYWRAFLKCAPPIYPDVKTGRWIRPDLSKNPEWTPPFRVIAQDTIKHEDALMVQIMNHPDFIGNVFPRCKFKDDEQKEVVSCCPELWSDEELQKDFETHKKEQQEDGFAMEIMCLPMARTSGSWTKSLFKYVHEREMRHKFDAMDETDKFIIIDPAKTSNSASARTAMLAVAFDPDSGIYLRDLINMNLQMHQIPEYMVEMAFATKTKHIFIEKTGGEMLTEYLFYNHLSQHGLQDLVKIHWIDARNVSYDDAVMANTGRNKAKEARASMLLPYYKQGMVYHDHVLRNSALERQQLSYPKPGMWDALDTAAYIPQILRMYGKFLTPTITETKHSRARGSISMDSFDVEAAIARREWCNT